MTRSPVWRLSIYQPTTMREDASIAAQQEILPSLVGCSVMSVIHNRSGPSALKRQRTRSSELGLPSLAPSAAGVSVARTTPSVRSDA